MTIRERIEMSEYQNLSPFAFKARETGGREYPVTECDIRTEFMRDRDRIVHCKSFRRLKDKTQVYLNPMSSHYRTRLTHTLEVSQIARTIAKALRLNEDLTEAIALGHDLGHTPFGHAGERELCKHIQFEHNVQSLRIVEKLENGKGLNLTIEVRDGILNHKKGMKPMTLEGMAVNFADRIAYINHDIDDAMRSGLFDETRLPGECTKVLGRGYGERINTMVLGVIESSEGKSELSMTGEIAEAMENLRQFMFDNVYFNPEVKSEEKKVCHIIDLLFERYRKRPELMGPQQAHTIETDGIDMAVADYIAGMTDKFATQQFEELFMPQSWKML